MCVHVYISIRLCVTHNLNVVNIQINILCQDVYFYDITDLYTPRRSINCGNWEKDEKSVIGTRPQYSLQELYGGKP